MEQNVRFGLILGRLAMLKIKNWANYEQLLRAFFSCFQGQKINLECFQKYCSVRTRKFHKVFFIKLFIFIHFFL